MRIALSVLISVLAACSSGTKPAATPPGPGSSEASHAACSTDADCVVVETACCDHCNGGTAEAFNTAFAAQHKATGCENTACTQMACGAAVAKCEAGACTVTIAPLE